MLDDMNVSNIYVNRNVSLVQLIYIRCNRENSQHTMLDNPEYNNI